MRRFFYTIYISSCICAMENQPRNILKLVEKQWIINIVAILERLIVASIFELAAIIYGTRIQI